VHKRLFKSKAGIKLDLGCGENRQPNFVTMDKRKLPNVDIVHDIQDIPYPIPSNSCLMVLMSHVWEHIEPKYRIDVMNEIWRIMKPDGQLLISAPYAGSFGNWQDPTHYMGPNEATFTYFDPKYPLYRVYKPKKWRLIGNNYGMSGNLEAILEAVKP
jgi:predicted SAM-dependent methyltransferase